MSEEEIKQSTASDEIVDTGAVVQENEQQARQVPLEALEAERHKRQELEHRNRILEDYAMRFQQQQQQRVQPEEDETELVNRRELKQLHERITKDEMSSMRRDISEETFKEVNPDAIKQINTHLASILERKPWLAKSIEEAPNRYSRAYEIVQDYAPAMSTRKSAASDAQRIVDNSKKPGSPVTIAKSTSMSNVDYLKSIGGKKEFREYRQKLLGKA